HVRQPRPLHDIRPETPADLAAVVERMMAKDPADRYQTPAEVADALAAWTRSPIPPPPAEEMPDPRLPVQGAWQARGLTGSPASVATDSPLPTARPAAADGDASSGS